MSFPLIHSFKGVGDRRKRQIEKCLRVKMTLKETNKAKSKGQRNDNEVLRQRTSLSIIRRTQRPMGNTLPAGQGHHHSCLSVNVSYGDITDITEGTRGAVGRLCAVGMW